MTRLDRELRDLRDRRRALVPYFMAGLTPNWTQYLDAAVQGGADVLEVGVPFSDPMMDGPVIQAAGVRALERGVTLEGVLDELARTDLGVPVVVMTYFNVMHYRGLERAAGLLASAGVAGVILPDLSLEESAPWRRAAGARDLATILMVAPSTPPDRVARIVATSQGFVYAAARMAVTGRASGDGEAARVVAGIREHGDVPVYVGIGISDPDQARHATRDADGVIVGSALVQRVLDGESPAELETLISRFRRTIDEGAPEA